MRFLFLGGLGLALGCLINSASAEDVKWRPAASRTAVQPTETSVSQFRGPTNNSAVQPVLFRPAVGNSIEPIIRAKNGEENLQPLPVGPSLGGPPPGSIMQPEQTPTPRVMQPNMGTGPYQGMPPQHMGGGVIYEAGPAVGCADGACGPTVVGPDWTDCGDSCYGGGYWGRNCCRLPHFYASAEYLAWWVSDMNAPPLVTGSNLSLAQINALAQDPRWREGGLNQVGTNVLLDGDTMDNPSLHGGRFTIGFGGHDHPWGFETTFFFLGERGNEYSYTSVGTPGLYRPFQNALDGLEDSQFVATPGLLAGNVTVDLETRLWGAEANFRRAMICDCNHKLDMLFGFRFMELRESLNITEDLTAIGRGTAPDGTVLITPGDRFMVQDSFGTRNRFYGGQFGLDYEKRFGRWYIGINGKIGLGNMQQVVLINGATSLVGANGATASGEGGLLAQPTNIGKYSRDRFAVIPEVGFKVGYQITDHLSAYAGYNFLYVNNVVRPGDQIDRVVNPSQLLRSTDPNRANNLVGPARPVFVFNDTDFWAQGVNFGLEYRW